ncbi:uncharacterized protein LOC115886322 [Sitophilus oryzae]|uniref:Uncharacterized protein LOC115886322 n=1 Tax=Sitophilus oryzae TaxID=7048 RepID=A0A6J2YD48_SITOR|nr:uncharacterized protein LOC115886322 [Sitophilus oryzae]
MFLCVLQIRKAVTNEFNVFQVAYVTRYAASTYVGLVFLELARKWNKLMRKWKEVEEEMKKYEFPKKLNRTIASSNVCIAVSGHVSRVKSVTSNPPQGVRIYHRLLYEGFLLQRKQKRKDSSKKGRLKEPRNNLAHLHQRAMEEREGTLTSARREKARIESRPTPGVEYFLHQASRIYRVAECQEDQEKAIKFFFSNLTLSHVFKYIPYSIPTSLVFQYWLFQIHFAFTYIDLFVMIISLSLASRMKQVTTNIKKTSKKEIADIEAWHQLREDYTRLSNLCHSVNATISNVILVSFLPNIFTILTQVYNSLKPRQNYVEAIYFYFSLVFLISRTAMVVICGATVYEESRRPLNILNSVSPKVYNKEITNQNVWKSIREDYVRLAKLCDLINKRLCWLIIISYLTNIYHILAQLFSSLKPMDDTFQKVYIYVSFFLLILRVTLVCFFGGGVYEEHGEIVKVLTAVPSSAYNMEVERFVSHLTTSEIVLTGRHFFKITRNLILKVASAVVTYELVLIQFNSKEFKRKN